MDWGGSSLAGPVLTVSTQPVVNVISQNFEPREQKCNHTRNRKLSLSLQESSICLDELLRLNTRRISIIPSAEVFTTPSRLLNWFRDRGFVWCRSRRFSVSAARYTNTHINIANWNTTGHDCGSLFVRGNCRRGWIGWLMKSSRLLKRWYFEIISLWIKRNASLTALSLQSLAFLPLPFYPSAIIQPTISKLCSFNMCIKAQFCQITIQFLLVWNSPKVMNVLVVVKFCLSRLKPGARERQGFPFNDTNARPGVSVDLWDENLFQAKPGRLDRQ